MLSSHQCLGPFYSFNLEENVAEENVAVAFGQLILISAVWFLLKTI